MTRLRLDQALVELGFYESRARARDAILRGTVTIDGHQATKPAQKVSRDIAVTLQDPASGYVSRAALKLIEGLGRFEIDVTGRVCLDIGASTGGFTQVLLERGARQVHAIDVGHDQMHETLRQNPKVVATDGLNARDLTSADLGGSAPTLLVSDVSFISLKLALPNALDLAEQGADAVLLIKPQFEAGKDRIGRGGLVAAETGEEIAQELFDWLNAYSGWISVALLPSPIKGGDGNAEYLLHGRKTG